MAGFSGTSLPLYLYQDDQEESPPGSNIESRIYYSCTCGIRYKYKRVNYSTQRVYGSYQLTHKKQEMENALNTCAYTLSTKVRLKLH